MSDYYWSESQQCVPECKPPKICIAIYGFEKPTLCVCPAFITGVFECDGTSSHVWLPYTIAAGHLFIAAYLIGGLKEHVKAL
ncbi:unnamed protein product, partial [Mesorhabditis spiculigera]